MKYMLEKPVKGIIGLQKYKTVIHWRNGVFISDEPEKLGGKDLGPDPFTLLLSSLVGCTLATLRMYIDHKNLIISDIIVEANIFYKIENEATVANIERTIAFPGQQDLVLHERLLRIAERCPISKLLKGNINISTELANMKILRFLVIGKKDEMLRTLKRVIENNEGWIAEISNSKTFSYKYLDERDPDIVLLSAGLDQTFKNSVKAYLKKARKRTKIIEHYRGGSGLLKNEVYRLFPELGV